jgi:YD repeat-containing protein
MRRLTTAWMGSTDVTNPGANSYTQKIDYAYDDDGNRTSVVVTPYGVGATTTNYSTNSLNEYTSVGGVGQSHDANGNLTGNGTLTFHYDYKNLIVQVKSGGTVISSYRYDALGRRVEKSVVAGSLVERYIRTTVETPGHWENLSHVVATFDVSNNWKQNFVWSDEVDGITMLEQADVLDFDTDTNTAEITRSFYHRNALGSVMDITDMNQAKVVAYRYDPYGKATITVGGTPHADNPRVLISSRNAIQEARSCRDPHSSF